MAAKPLNAAEKSWLKRLQKLIDECPSTRMAAFTTGDNDLTIYDLEFEDEINELLDTHECSDFCLAVREAEAELGSIVFPFSIHSTSG